MAYGVSGQLFFHVPFIPLDAANVVDSLVSNDQMSISDSFSLFCIFFTFSACNF